MHVGVCWSVNVDACVYQRDFFGYFCLSVHRSASLCVFDSNARHAEEMGAK